VGAGLRTVGSCEVRRPRGGARCFPLTDTEEETEEEEADGAAQAKAVRGGASAPEAVPQIP